jgi:hypothetical protein
MAQKIVPKAWYNRKMFLKLARVLLHLGGLVRVEETPSVSASILHLLQNNATV